MWHYQEREFTPEDVQANFGFVYEIHDNLNGKKYIGQKRFHFQKTLPPLKGQKRKRKIITPSDWENYHGSNETLKKAVAKNTDPTRFRRDILYLCNSAAELNYIESREIFNRDALISDEYYNEYIQCRINSSHVKSLKAKK